jgi:predicted RNase H-like HicB family nuclease
MNYKIIIYWREEDSVFVAEVPEIAGCMADGATYQKALANLKLLLTNGLKQRGVWADRFPN